MTARKKATAKSTGKRKSLSVARRTLKDLSPRGEGPKGGFIMRDTVIVRTGR